MNETTKLSNIVKIISQDGKVLSETKNITCAVGRTAMMTQLLSPALNSGMKEIACGDGTTPATESDTALSNETARVGINFVQTVQTDTQIVAYCTFDTVEELDINELGLFMGAGSDILLAKTIMPTTVTKLNGESITIEWTLNLNNA